MKPPLEKPLTEIEWGSAKPSATSAATMPSMNETSSIFSFRAGPQQCGAWKLEPMPSGATSPTPRASATSANLSISISAVHPKQCTRTMNGSGFACAHDDGSRTMYDLPSAVDRCAGMPHGCVAATLSHGRMTPAEDIVRVDYGNYRTPSSRTPAKRIPGEGRGGGWPKLCNGY